MLALILFILIYAAALALCVYFAVKRNWLKSCVSAMAALIPLPLSYSMAKKFVGAFGASLSGALKEGFLQLLNLRNDIMLRDEALLRVSSYAVNAILGIAAFWLCFLALWGMLTLIKHFIIFGVIINKDYKSYDPPKKLPILSAAFSLVSFGAVTFALLFPLGAASDIAASAAKVCDYRLPASVINNPIGRVYGIAGRGFFDSLTEIEGVTEFVNSDEAQRGAEIYIALRKVAEGADSDDSSIDRISGSLKSSYLMTDLTSEIAANAANSWKNGRRYMNITPKLPDGRSGELVRDVLEIMSGWERENLIQDIDTAINVYKLLREKEITRLSDGEALFAALSEEEFDKELFAVLSKSRDFIAVIPKVLRFGIGTAVDAMEMEMNDDYIVELDAASLSEQDWQREASAFSLLISRMKTMSEGNTDTLGLLADLYSVRDSKLIGNVLINLLIQILYNLQLAAG